MTTLLLGAVIGVGLGVLLISYGYFLSQPDPFLSYLLTSFGTLLIFGFAYTCYSEIGVYQKITTDIKRSINHSLDLKRKHKSIEDIGIDRIFKWSNALLMEKIEDSRECKIVVLYSLDFFKRYYEQVAKCVNRGLSLQIVMLKKDDDETSEVLSRNFENYTSAKVSERVSEAHEYISKFLCAKVKDDFLSNIQLRTVDFPLTYSAYLFDDKELWWLPRHSTKGKANSLVFVIKGEGLSSNLFYEDLQKLFSDEESNVVSLEEELE